MMTMYGDQEFELRYLREVVDPSLAGLPGFALREQVDSVFGEGFAEAMDADLEGAFDGIGRAFSSAARDVGRFAKRAAPVAAHIGGGVIQGAMSGSAAGLPGIIAGAAVGGAGAGMSRFGSGAVRQAGQALTGVTQLAGQFSPVGSAGGAIGSAVSRLGSLAGSRGRPNFGRAGLAKMGAFGGGAGGGAMTQVAGMLQSPQAAGALAQLFGGGSGAGQLLSASRRPETQQALAALHLGPMGRPSIPVGPQQTPVPTAAFAQLLGHLAQQAAGAAPPWQAAHEGEGIAFMSDGEGGFYGDPASTGDRAARLWDMMNEAQAERLIETIEYEAWPSDADGYETEGEFHGADSEFYDALDLADAEAIEFALESEARHVW
jgi:hypothetical protein